MNPPVVLIHGMWSTGTTLEPIRKAFESRGFSCHSPTLPFHDNGGNAAQVGKLSHTDYVNFLETYVKNLNLPEPPILIAHSMGGLLAQLLAVRIPTRALILFAPAAAAGINGFALSSIRSLAHALFSWKFWDKAQIHPTLESAQYALFNNLPLERQQELFKLLVPESGRVLFEAGLGAKGEGKPTWVDFEKITSPILIQHGTDDRIVIVQGSRQVVGKYKNATLKEYEGSGHWLFEEEVNQKIFEDAQGWLQSQSISATL
jgi:pimeloyl-ACP methyl ester carboxylesterase